MDDLILWTSPSCSKSGATRDELLDALSSDPALIQRPIAIRGDRAVVTRPPERLLELLEERAD